MLTVDVLLRLLGAGNYKRVVHKGVLKVAATQNGNLYITHDRLRAAIIYTNGQWENFEVTYSEIVKDDDADA